MEVIANLVNLRLMPAITNIDTHYDLPFEARARIILIQAQGLEAFDGGIYFLNQQGEVLKTHPEQPELAGQDWSGNPQFRHVMDNSSYGGVFTDLLTIEPSGKKILCLVQTMIGPEGETIGAGYYCFTIYPATQNTYYQDLSEQNLGPNFSIVDGNHQIIYSPDPSEMGIDISAEAYMQQLLLEESQSGWFRDRTEDMLVNYLSLSSDKNIMRWVAINKGSWAEIMQTTQVYRQLLFILLAFVSNTGKRRLAAIAASDPMNFNMIWLGLACISSVCPL